MSDAATEQCRLCGEYTECVFNINFRATAICDGCANAVMLQQAQDLVVRARQHREESDDS